MGNKVVFSKFINIDLFVCGSHLNTRIGGRPMLRDREMARAGPEPLTVRGRATVTESELSGVMTKSQDD